MQLQLKKWCSHQLDIKLAFLNGEITEEVYLDQPQGYIQEGDEHKVLRLRKHCRVLNKYQKHAL